jgi:2-deoxy-D-gluconate 3-dehydrogenase
MTQILDRFDLAGRAAIVTGGPGLLGKEFCRTLAEAGAAVVVADIDFQGAEVVANALAKDGYKSLSVKVDVTQPDSVQVMVNATLEAFGQVDILVNSAPSIPSLTRAPLPQAKLHWVHLRIILFLPGSKPWM